MPDAGVGPMLIVIGLWTFLRVMLCGSATIALENLALRHQLAVSSPDHRQVAAQPALDPLGTDHPANR